MQKIVVPAVAAPIVAGAVALLGTFLAYKITQWAKKKTVDDRFRFGQIASASLVSLAHGTGDAQKTMHIDWTALSEVALVSLLFGVGLAVLFAFGVTAMSRRAVAIDEKKQPAVVDAAVAALCFAACLAAVLYGLYLIIPQFH